MKNTFSQPSQEKAIAIVSVFIFTEWECDRSIPLDKVTNPDIREKVKDFRQQVQSDLQKQ